MPINFSDFHFIRVELLLLLIPIFILLVYVTQMVKQQSAWENIISPHLLKYLLVDGKNQRAKSGVWLTGIIATLAVLAISGPTFREKSVPVFQSSSAQVILLDLSLSMDATDIKPSRIERAKFKLLDLLAETNEGTVALVIYAGDAFVISPLTSDAKTVANMVPTLSTGIMPVLGSRPDLAIEKSIALLKNAKHTSGQIIWLTDGVESNYIDKISELINQSKYQLSILAVGTELGAPIPLREGNGFLKDSSGAIVVPKLLTQELQQIAANTQAGLVQLTPDKQDIHYLLEYSQMNAMKDAQDDQNEQKISRWVDDGYWIVWLVLLFMLIKLFKQPLSLTGGFAPFSGILILLVVSFPQSAHAISWQDLWLTKNQQAEQAFEKGEYADAAGLYQDPEWQAAARYKNGDFEQAAQQFATAPSLQDSQSIENQYNQATSLAKANKLEDALALYNLILQQQPQHEDAAFNKKIIEDLLKQQQEQQDKDKDQQESEQQDKNEDQQQSESDSESQEKSDEESQQQDQEEQEQSEEQQAEQESQEEKASEEQMQITEDQREKSEKDQALEHWLEKIPDDPGGLLRQKMYREYQRRGRQQKEEILW